MRYSEPARAARRNRSTGLTALVIALAAISGVLVHQSLSSSVASSEAPPSAEALDPPASSTEASERPADPVTSPIDAPRVQRRRRAPAIDRGNALGVADGAIPDGVTIFDGGVPGVANLDPELAGALRRAASDAAAVGVRLVVDSGWRSPAYQEQLLREAVSKYGSQEEAARWVATPATSAHVSGDAVDIGPSGAATWLSQHGAAYGLCQIYANEPWHFELRPDAVGAGCPAMYADPTQDPRMQP